MHLEIHRQRIDSLPFGKRLPGAIYVARPGPDDVSAELLEIIDPLKKKRPGKAGVRLAMLSPVGLRN